MSSFLTHRLPTKEAKDVLDELLDNIQFKNTMVHHQVANHIMHKDTFNTPAYAFDYLGEGISKHHEKVHETSFRRLDGLRIATQANEIITPNFKQYNGEMVNQEEQLFLYLDKNEWVNYRFDSSKQQVFLIEVVGENVSNTIIFINQVEYHHEDGKMLVHLPKGDNLLKIVAKSNVKLEEIIFKTSS